jgi:hypothetical protein
MLHSAGLTVALIHINDAIDKRGLLESPTESFDASLYGLLRRLLLVIVMKFLPCMVRRDAFPPGGVNTSVRGRRHNRLVFGRLILTITCSAL